MLKSSLTLCCLVALTACGSDTKGTSAQASGGTTQEGAGTVPLSALALNSSKMAQQATTSSQAQADHSETASSGADDSSGTSSRSLAQGRGGQLGIRPQPGVDFNQTLTVDFDVDLDFMGYVGPDQITANGNVRASVRHGGMSSGESQIVLEGTLDETDSKGHKVRQSTEPNVTVDKKGSRTGGKIERKLRGIIRRTLEADAADASFDLLINHTNTLVTDLYADSSLSKRTISGEATISDQKSGDSAVLTFTNVERGAPKVCLCPTAGTITAAYTHAGTTKTISHTFSGTCGEVIIEESLAASATASMGSKATDGSAASTTSANQDSAVSSDGTSVSSTAQTQTTVKVVWANCTPS